MADDHAVVREGFYRRTLVVGPGADPKKPPSITVVGAVENAGDQLRSAIGIDGYERAFLYQPAPLGATGSP